LCLSVFFVRWIAQEMMLLQGMRPHENQETKSLLLLDRGTAQGKLACGTAGFSRHAEKEGFLPESVRKSSERNAVLCIFPAVVLK
jgi:hypothetical protein